MVDFYESLNKFLLSKKELKDVISNRIYPLRLPQNPKLPSMIYTPISTNYGKNLQQESGFVSEIVQFTIHSTTFGKARQVSRIVRHALKDFVGDMFGIDIGAVHCITDISGDSDDNGNEYMWVIEMEFQYNCE